MNPSSFGHVSFSSAFFTNPFPSTTGNLTYAVFELISLYSISGIVMTSLFSRYVPGQSGENTRTHAGKGFTRGKKDNGDVEKGAFLKSSAEIKCFEAVNF